MSDIDTSGPPAQRPPTRVKTWFARGKAGGKTTLLSGLALAVVAAIALVAVPSPSREESDGTKPLSGKALFESLMEARPELLPHSRIQSGPERGSGVNRMVLPLAVWEGLQLEQRHSLAFWLDSLGGTWEIKVGKVSADGGRIDSQQAVVNSREWHQQLK